MNALYLNLVVPFGLYPSGILTLTCSQVYSQDVPCVPVPVPVGVQVALVVSGEVAAAFGKAVFGFMVSITQASDSASENGLSILTV